MATIENYTTKTGRRYRVRYRKPDGRQTDKRGFTTKKAAEAFAATVEVDKLTGNYIEPALGRENIGALGIRWHQRKVYDKPSWQTRQESILRIHIMPGWGHRAVSTITTPEIRDWIAELRKDLQPSTVTDIHGVLAAILDTAVEEKRIADNPARNVPLPKRTIVEHNYLTHLQVLQLANEVSKYSEIILLLAYTGLRWGEMAALRPRDIDLERRRIYVTRSASKVNSKSPFVAPKSWERRSIAIPQRVADALAPIIAAAPSLDALLWSRPDGSPLRPPTTTSWFMKAVDRLVERTTPRNENKGPMGPSFFPRITAHELRHTAASLMIASGAHVKTVQTQLGHKSATLTLDSYGHLFDDDLDAIADRMDRDLIAAECGQNVGTTAVTATL